MYSLETRLCFSSARSQEERKSWLEAIVEREVEKAVPENGRRKQRN